MNNSDAKTKRTTRRRNKAISPVIPRSEKCPTAQSQVTGLQGYIPNDQGISIWGDRYQHLQPANATIGKILERLDSLEQRFFSYVKAHQDSLDATKQESKLQEEEFAHEAATLRQEIINLISLTDDTNI